MKYSWTISSAVTANVYNAPTKIVRPFNFWWGPHGPDFCHYGFVFYGASPKGPNDAQNFALSAFVNFNTSVPTREGFRQGTPKK